MNKVLFDGVAMQSDSRSKFHGGSEYAKYILSASLKYGYKFDIVLNPNLYLEKEIKDLLIANSIRIIEVSSKQDLYRILDDENYDVFYSALPYDYYDYHAKSKIIGVIHGLRPIEIVWDRYKHKFYKKRLSKFICWGVSKMNFTKQIIRNKRIIKIKKLLNIDNAKFITVSNHSKYALVNFFPSLSPEKISVYYSPFEIFDNDKIANLKNNYGKYFLLVSGNRFEKNTYRAIIAFDRLFSNGTLTKEFKVIITGAENLPFKKEIQNTERFVLMPYVDKDELSKLYSNAFCFVYPSLNEGFGYPPLIAMSKRVTVIASSATSIPEVCRDGAIYFTPESIDELCNRILNVVNDEELRLDLCTKGLKRVSELQDKQKVDVLDYLKLIYNN